MPSNAIIFELFEILCNELERRPDAQVINEAKLGDPELLAELKRTFKETNEARAFERGVEALAAHFAERGAKLPFSYDLPTREFTPVDHEYLDFIELASALRGKGVDSKEFEIATLKRLKHRLTGSLRRVGHPRDIHKKKAEYLNYLRKLGFDKNALEANDKDGGFDILWLPPIGAVPLRPIVAFQCKNSSFDEKDAGASTERSSRTFARHSQLRRSGTMHLVVFNDYIDNVRYVGRATGWGFLPIGLSDLAQSTEMAHHEVL